MASLGNGRNQMRVRLEENQNKIDNYYRLHCCYERNRQNDNTCISRYDGARHCSVPSTEPDANIQTGERMENDKGRVQTVFQLFHLHKGMLFALLSCFLFACASICIKSLAGEIHASQVVAFRFVVQLLCTSVCLVYYRISLWVTRKELLLLVIRAITGAISMICGFSAYQFMSVGDASAIVFTSPIFTGIFAWLLLKERFTLFDVVFAVFALIGVVLIARPTFLFGQLRGPSSEDGNHMLGSILSILSAVFMAFAYVSIRKLGGINVHHFVIIWIFAVAGLFFAIPVTTVLGVWRIPKCGLDRIFLVVIGLLGFTGQIFLMHAFRLEKASYVAMVRSNDVIIAFILEYVVFGTIPFWLSALGVIFILSSSLGMIVKKSRSAQKKIKAEEELDDSRNDNENSAGPRNDTVTSTEQR